MSKRKWKWFSDEWIKENEWKKMNRRMNERMRERMRERMNEKMNERMNEWMKEWMNESMNERNNELWKKAWFVWIVDLKLSKKLKGKQEKKKMMLPSCGYKSI